MRQRRGAIAGLEDIVAVIYGVFFGAAPLVVFLDGESARTVLYVALGATAFFLTLLTAVRGRNHVISRRQLIEVLPFVTLTFAAGLTASLRGLPGNKSLEVVVAVLIAFIGIPIVISTRRAVGRFVAGLVLPSFGAVLAASRLALDGTIGRLGLVEGGNPIVSGRAAGLALVLISFLLLRGGVRRTVHWWIFLAFVPPVVVVLLQAGSVGPIVSYGAALAFFVLRREPRVGGSDRATRIRRIAVAGVASISALVIYRWFDLAVPQRVITPGEAGSGRPELFRAGFELASRYPLGVGFGGFGPDSGLYPHNIFVEVAAEMGLLAVLAFVALLYLAFRQLARAQSSEATLIIGLLIYAIINASVSSNLTGNRTVFGLVAIGLAYSRIEDVRPLAKSQRQIKLAGLGESGGKARPKTQ